MAENEPQDHLPALPAPAPPPAVPPGLDADEYRRFQEFQRFQDYQRFVAQGGGPPNQGAPGGLVPVDHNVARELAGVREHLADLATTQAKINRAVNPPLWRKILRSRLAHRLAWLAVVVAIGIWGVPLLIENVLGNHDNADSNGGLPLPKQESGTLAQGPHDAVHDVYMFIADNHPAEACHGLSLIAQLEFAKAGNTTNCPGAMSALSRQVTDPATYGDPNLRELPTPEGTTDTISSCAFPVSGGPRLGTFTVTQQAAGWEITNYSPPTACPTPTPTPPTS